MKQTKNSKVVIWVVIAAILVVGGIVACLFAFNNNGNDAAGSTSTPQVTATAEVFKYEVTIEVVDDKGETKSYQVKTNKDTLQGVMDETEGLTYSGTEGQYGLMVDTVNGVKAVYETDQAYWSFYVNDSYCESGIATQKVNNQDVFRIVYTKG
ncbi:MAG: DUF4430 domain-containing protein [bacterium]|nr:DUF4430 domain-containing protein [bacterium]